MFGLEDEDVFTGATCQHHSLRNDAANFSRREVVDQHDTASITITGGAASKGFKAAFIGMILIGLDSAQPLKSLSGISSVQQVLSGVPGSGDEQTMVTAPVITSLSAKGAPVCPDMISASLSKVSVQPGAFRVADGIALIDGNLVPGMLISTSPMKSITAKAKKISGTIIGGKIGVAGDILATVIMINGDISTISAQDLSATILAGFRDGLPTHTGTIKKIIIRGTIAGEAYVSTDIKFTPKSLDTSNFAVILP